MCGVCVCGVWARLRTIYLKAMHMQASTHYFVCVNVLGKLTLKLKL